MFTTKFERNGGLLIAKPQGRLDTNTSIVFDTELKQRLDGVQELVMDFSDVPHISSAGLRVLLTTEQLMSDRAGSMKLVHVNDFIIDIFDLVGFMEVVDVVQD